MRTQVATLGLSMIPEGRMLFRDMGVEENVLLGAYPPHLRDAAVSRLERIRAAPSTSRTTCT